MRSGRVVALSAVQPAARAATAVDILGAIGVAELAAGIAKAAPLVVFNGKVSGSLRLAAASESSLANYESRKNSHPRRRAVQEHHLRHAKRGGRPVERLAEALGRQGHGLDGTQDSEPA